MGTRRLVLVYFSSLVAFYLLYNLLSSSGIRSEVISPAPDSDDSYPLNQPSRVRAHQGTYVTLRRYSGQQGAGVRALASLQCFLKSLKLNFWIAEPEIVNSSFRGRPDGGGNGGGLKFGDLFDKKLFNIRSKKRGHPLMVSMEKFIQQHPKYTIIIKRSNESSEILWSSEPGGEVHCLTSNNYTDLTYESVLNLTDPSRCIVRVVKLRIDWVYNVTREENQFDSVRTLRLFLFGDWSPSDVTLEFTIWAGPYNVLDRHHHCYLEYNSSRTTNSLFKPSKRLLQDAKRYNDMFLKGENRLAIMIRTEKVVMFYFQLNKSSSLEECFQQVLNLSREMGSEKPLVTLDMGRFGSSTVYNLNDTEEVQNASRAALVSLYRDQWTFEEWEDSFVEATGGETKEAYVAALQRILASRADCLVLMGGGNFQALAVEGYLNYHENSSEWCIYSVCGTPQRTPLMASLMRKYKIHVNKTLFT